MQSHPTLSRELVDLFETVSKQADEYTDIFNIMRRKVRELENIRTEMQQHLHSFRAECTEELESNKRNLEDCMHGLATRIAFVQDVYAEMEDIDRLRQELLELRDLYHNRTIELDTVIHSIRSTLQNETEAAFLDQDKKIAHKIQGLEAQIVSFDTRLYNTQDLHRREFMAVSEEVNRFKNKISETKFIVDEASKVVNETVELADRNMTEKIRKYTTDIDQKIKTALDALTGDQPLKSRIDKIRSDIVTLDRKFNGYEQRNFLRSGLPIGLSLISLILSALLMMSR